MTVLVDLGRLSANWATHLQASLHALDVDASVATTRDDVDPLDVEFLVMWRRSADELAAYPNLRAVLMAGAGFDHLDLATMPGIPFVRLIDPGMAHDIASYVLAWTIHFQRDFDVFAAAAERNEWIQEPPPRFTRDITVGVFGRGAIGEVVLDMCARHGHPTIGWSRSDHDRPLLQFFTDCDVVVDLVPLSDATRNIIGAAELRALGDGVLINVGRGPTVDHEALIDALDADLRGAVLDVTDPEPLPADSPLWDRPDVIITPHVAGRSDPVTAAPVVANSIADLLAGRTPTALIPR